MWLPERIYLAVQPVDLRQGIDGLAVQVRALGHPGFDGAAYLFRNRAGTRLKMLLWDGHGFWLCLRRLERGRFDWPTTGVGTQAISRAQWAWLVQGARWQQLAVPPRPTPTAL
jgi:transposase